MSAETFLLLGLIILVGFTGHVFYEYTKVPEILFMILIGLTIGPFLKFVDPANLMQLSPLISILALHIVLLDAGLSLDVFGVIKSLGKSALWTLLVLIFCTFIIGTFMYVAGWSPLHALLIGAVNSGTATVVVVSILSRVSVPREVEQLLVIESIANDVTLSIVVVILLQLITVESLDLRQLSNSLVGPITVAVILGVAFSIMWTSILWRHLREQKLVYVFTLGFLFVLYALVEIIGGNGIIASLVLCLSLGNLPAIFERLSSEIIRLHLGFLEHHTGSLALLTEHFTEVLNSIKKTQIDIAFFIRNLFFVYLGAVFELEGVSPAILLICFSMMGLILLSRFLASKVLILFDQRYKGYSTIMTLTVARGFVATLLVFLPSAKGVEIPLLKEIMLFMVILSTFTTIVGSSIYGRRAKIKGTAVS